MDFSTSFTNRPRRIRSRFSFLSPSVNRILPRSSSRFNSIVRWAALTLLAAELYNILAFHLTLAPASIAPALLACVLWVLVFLQYRESFKGIFSAKPATQP